MCFVCFGLCFDVVGIRRFSNVFCYFVVVVVIVVVVVVVFVCCCCVFVLVWAWCFDVALCAYISKLYGCVVSVFQCRCACLCKQGFVYMFGLLFQGWCDCLFK